MPANRQRWPEVSSSNAGQLGGARGKWRFVLTSLLFSLFLSLLTVYRGRLAERRRPGDRLVRVRVAPGHAEVYRRNAVRQRHLVRRPAGRGERQERRHGGRCQVRVFNKCVCVISLPSLINPFPYFHHLSLQILRVSGQVRHLCADCQGDAVPVGPQNLGPAVPGQLEGVAQLAGNDELDRDHGHLPAPDERTGIARCMVEESPLRVDFGDRSHTVVCWVVPSKLDCEFASGLLLLLLCVVFSFHSFRYFNQARLFALCSDDCIFFFVRFPCHNSN